MNIKYFAVIEYCKNHSQKEIERLVSKLFGTDSSRDNRGHYYGHPGASCPHGKAGKRMARSALKKEGKSGTISSATTSKTTKMVAEKDISRQTDNQLRKGIKKYHKRIEEHERKIEHPEKVYDDWETASEEKRDGRLKHWKHELQTFRKNILDRERELDRRAKK